MRKFLLFVLMFLFLFSCSVWASVYCGSCRAEIRGQYVKFQNVNLCQECYKKYIKYCAICRGVVSEGSTDGRNFYCAPCMAKAKRCSICNGILIGEYGIDGNNNYCSSCIKKTGQTLFKEQCAFCGKIPMKYAMYPDAQGVKRMCCQDCLEKRGVNTNFTCSKCSRLINHGRYKSEVDQYGVKVYTCAECVTGKTEVNVWLSKCFICGENMTDKGTASTRSTETGKPYCYDCCKKYPACNFCSCPVVDNNYPEPSHPLCVDCRKDAVTSKSQLNSLYMRTKDHFRRFLGVDIPIKIENVVFADRGALEARTMGSFSARGTFDSVKIYVKKGMTSVETAATLSHEYAHAYHYFSTPQYGNSASIFKEGFADWIMYKYLASAGQTNYYVRRTKNLDPIYGEGLRKFLMLEKKYGANGALKYLNENTDFPKDL